MRRNIKMFFSLLALFCVVSECEGQNKRVEADFDYYSLALTSISNSVGEASKLPDIPQRVKLLLQAVALLPASQHEEAVRLLEGAMRDVNEWSSADNANWSRKHTAVTLRNEILALCSRVDPKKAAELQRELQPDAKSATTSGSSNSLKSENWFTYFSDKNAIADRSAMMAASIIDSHPDKALKLVALSLQGGTVSNVLVEIVQKLVQRGDRAFLNKLEGEIARALAGSITDDPFSLSSAAILVLADKDMAVAHRSAFIRFFMRSLQAWAILVKQPEIDPTYTSRVFLAFSQPVGLVISRYSPEQGMAFNSVLDQVLPLLSEKTKSIVEPLQPETVSDPFDKLNSILRESDLEMRDRRLVRFVSEIFRNDSKNSESKFELASKAIDGLTDTEAKSAYTELLTIKRVDASVKQEKFIEGQELADSLSSVETRAWALLALASAATRTDRVLGFELISNALKTLDKASPGPKKVELALMAAGMLAMSDQGRAFDALLTASTYANSSASSSEPNLIPPFAFGLEASIGEARTKIGVFPETLAGLRTDPSLSILATTDWFRADQIANRIRNAPLRLQLKLQFAGAVLTQETKRRRKEESRATADRAAQPQKRPNEKPNQQ